MNISRILQSVSILLFVFLVFSQEIEANKKIADAASGSKVFLEKKQSDAQKNAQTGSKKKSDSKFLSSSLGANIVRMSIRIVYSTLVTEITLTPAGLVTLGKMTNNRGLELKQNLGQNDFVYSQKQFFVAKDPGHATCPKSFIEISYFDGAQKKVTSASACYREKNPQSKIWTESVETLAKTIQFRPN